MTTPQTAIFSGSQFDQRGKKFAIAPSELCFSAWPAAKTKTAQSCGWDGRRSEVGKVKVHRRDTASVRQLYKSTFRWQKENLLPSCFSPWKNPRFLSRYEEAADKQNRKKENFPSQVRRPGTALDDCAAIDEDHHDEGFRSGLICDRGLVDRVRHFEGGRGGNRFYQR